MNLKDDDIDVNEIIKIFDEYVEHHVLNYLGILNEFELVIYLNKDEFLLSFHKNKKILLEKDIDVPFKKSSLFLETDLVLEINALFKNSTKKRIVNQTYYYTLQNTSNEEDESDELDDGIVISSSIYNINIQHYLDFKSSFIANIAKAISNAKFYLNKNVDIKQNEDFIVMSSVILYYNYYNKYKHSSIRDIVFCNDIHKLLDESLKIKLIKMLENK